MMQHPGMDPPTAIEMSLDGVPESKQSLISLEVVSIRFHGPCKKVYPVCIGVAGRLSEGLTCKVTQSSSYGIEHTQFPTISIFVKQLSVSVGLLVTNSVTVCLSVGY